MPQACVRCGAQNPDGNVYCEACGTPLGAPPGVTTGAFAGPPPGPPPNFQSPYYAPTGVGVPVHRTPWTLIVAAVVALTVVLGGVGTALAMLHGSPSTPGVIGDVPSPTPGLTPSPVAPPTSTQAATGLQSRAGFSLTLPSGWVVESKDSESIVVSDPYGGGTVTVASGPSIPSQTAQQNKDSVDAALKSKYPDTQNCPNTRPAATTFNGESGVSWTLCFTVVQGGRSAAAAASLFAGANKAGSVYYLVMVVSSQGNLQSFLNTSKPVVQSVQWKLS